MVGRTGNFIDLETSLLANYLFSIWGGKVDAVSNEFIKAFPLDCYELFLFRTPLAKFEQSNLILLLGCNLRKENPLLFLRLRRSFLQKKATDVPLRVFAIGSGCAYEGLPITQLGCSVRSLELLLVGRLNGMKDFFFNGFFSPHILNIFDNSAGNIPKVIVGPAIFHLAQARQLLRRI